MSLYSYSLQLLSTYSLTPLSGIYPNHSTKIVCIKGMGNFHTAKHNGQLVVLILINLSVSFDTTAPISITKILSSLCLHTGHSFCLLYRPVEDEVSNEFSLLLFSIQPHSLHGLLWPHNFMSQMYIPSLYPHYQMQTSKIPLPC